MKLSRTLQLLIATTSLVSVQILGGNFSQASTPVNLDRDGVANVPTLIAQNSSPLKMGTFVKGEAPTTGMVKIVKENGKTFLEIDSAFSTTDQAPDMHVLLEPAAVPPKTYTNMNGYINLGKLKAFKGAQRYPVPTAIDLSQYKSVVIWCRMANATIGYATLK